MTVPTMNGMSTILFHQDVRPRNLLLPCHSHNYVYQLARLEIFDQSSLPPITEAEEGGTPDAKSAADK
jgi:hypothetical protein